MNDASPVRDRVVRAQRASMPGHDGPARTDRVYDRIAQAMSRARPAQVTLTRYQSLDPIGHYFLRYAQPSDFGDVTEEERRRLGSVLERHYSMIDEAIGRAMAGLGPDDLLVVVSGYGMEPLGLGKRLIERLIGDPEISGTHEAAPDGFLLAYGASVARGRRAGARIGRRRHADDPLFPRPAARARHGRLRQDRSVSAVLHRAAPDHVHPDVRQVARRLGARS